MVFKAMSPAEITEGGRLDREDSESASERPSVGGEAERRGTNWRTLRKSDQ